MPYDRVDNQRIIYPVTIDKESLRKAALSPEGVQDLIARIIDNIWQSTIIRK